MIAGVGVDLVDLAAFRRQLDDPASTFLEAVFTVGERRYAATRPSRDPARHLAARYAAKEAFLKAWSAGNRGARPAEKAVDYREIEVVCDDWGRPGLRLHGRVARALGPGLRTWLSLTHDGGYAAAYVVLERVP